jgi:hypothetical protein
MLFSHPRFLHNPSGCESNGKNPVILTSTIHSCIGEGKSQLVQKSIVFFFTANDDVTSLQTFLCSTFACALVTCLSPGYGFAK